MMRVETGETGSVPPEVRAAAASAEGMETLRRRLVVARLDSWPPAQTHPACVRDRGVGGRRGSWRTATAARVAEHAVLGAADHARRRRRGAFPEVPVFTAP